MTAKLGSVGRACLYLELDIWDDDGSPVAAGERGEVVLRGPKVFPGYWRDPEATAKAFRGGWFHTGDIGVKDDDGYLYIVDRLKDMIVSGGENIASSEVERVLYEHPAVLETAVIGRPDERWGEVPVAVVVLKPGASATADELIEHCRGQLAKFKVPKAVTFIDALPRNPSGKVLKRELRTLMSELRFDGRVAVVTGAGRGHRTCLRAAARRARCERGGERPGRFEGRGRCRRWSGAVGRRRDRRRRWHRGR